MPIFHEYEIITVAATKGHVNDVGGINPRSWGPASSEVYEEGVFIPRKTLQEDELDSDVMDIILASTRIPDYVKRDIEALVAGLRVAEKRIRRLIEKYGAEVV